MTETTEAFAQTIGAPTEAVRGGRSRLNRELATVLMPYLYCAALIVAIAFLNSSVLIGPGAIDIRATALMPLALIGFGQTLAIFTGGIDLAVGGIMSAATALLATHFNGSGVTLVAELLAVVGLGALGGAANGLVIARTSLQPFIVTLSTWSVWGGIAILFLPQEGGAVSPQLTSWITGSVGPIPKSVLAIAALVLLWLWLRWSRFVLDLKAIGSDVGRARLAGVPVARRKFETYVVSGAFAALAGIWLAGQQGGGSPVVGNEYILTSVAAVVIGGTSIFGGRGSVAATIAGGLALQMIPDLIFTLNISSFWTGFVQGVLLIVAVLISSLVLQVGRGRVEH
jgi:ribose transport system permease protein